MLNTAHSALAYLGISRGYQFVRGAIADPELCTFLDGLIEEEVAPYLAPQDARSYWRATRARFGNPHIDHRLEQIAEDGSAKLAQRVFPVLIANVHDGLPYGRLARIVRAWLDFARARDVVDPARERLKAWSARGGEIDDALNDDQLFPEAFRNDPHLRAALGGS